MSPLAYRLAADGVLLAHGLFVLFVIMGLLLTLAGAARGWTWVRNPWFRGLHLGAIAVVVLQAWLGMVCPLTTLEMALRASAGDAIYAGSFIAHWMGRLLYYHAPQWVFVVAYSLFGLAVLATWVLIPPIRKRPTRSTD